MKVLFRTYRGEEVVRTLPIEIPANASGTLSLLVSDGARLGQSELRELRSPQPRSVDQMIRALNKGRRNNTLYVKLLGSEAGAVVNASCGRRCRVGSRRARKLSQGVNFNLCTSRDGAWSFHGARLAVSYAEITVSRTEPPRVLPSIC